MRWPAEVHLSRQYHRDTYCRQQERAPGCSIADGP